MNGRRGSAMKRMAALTALAVVGAVMVIASAGPVAADTLVFEDVFTAGTCNPDSRDQVVPDVRLDPLADNGGPTSTHALQPGSPAIDAATLSACPATDQRGVDAPAGGGL